MPEAAMRAVPCVKRLMNRTLIERIEITGGQLAGPFAGHFLLASSNEELWSGGRFGRQATSSWPRSPVYLSAVADPRDLNAAGLVVDAVEDAVITTPH